MFTLLFWKDALARAVEMSAHATVTALGAKATFVPLHWTQVAALAGTAFVTSLATSLIAVPAPGSPGSVGPLLRVFRARRHGEHEATR